MATPRETAIQQLLAALGNMDTERMRRMRSDTSGDNEGSNQITETPQFPDREMDDINILQAKGSDSDSADHTLDQRRAAPQNQDTTDGDTDADTGETDSTGSNAWQTLRDAAKTGDTTARGVQALFDDEPGNDLGHHGEGAEDMEIENGDGGYVGPEGEEGSKGFGPEGPGGGDEADFEPPEEQSGGVEPEGDNIGGDETREVSDMGPEADEGIYAYDPTPPRNKAPKMLRKR